MYAGCNTTRYELNTISKPSAYEISLCLLDIDQQPTHSLGVETSEYSPVRISLTKGTIVVHLLLAKARMDAVDSLHAE